MLTMYIKTYEEPYKAQKHVILRHFYCFLPEESDKLGCHNGVIQVTLILPHNND